MAWIFQRRVDMDDLTDDLRIRIHYKLESGQLPYDCPTKVSGRPATGETWAVRRTNDPGRQGSTAPDFAAAPPPHSPVSEQVRSACTSCCTSCACPCFLHSTVR